MSALAIVPLPSLPPRVILDTNALMDWLVFRHPACAGWEAALRSQWACWVVTPELEAEWRHVRARGIGADWASDPAHGDELWSLAERPVLPAPPLTLPQCTDPDDQKFVDVAVLCGARWLVTRDKALHRLRRGLFRRGVSVVTPEGWTAALADCHGGG